MVEISLYGSGEGPGWVTAPGYSTAGFLTSDNAGSVESRAEVGMKGELPIPGRGPRSSTASAGPPNAGQPITRTIGTGAAPAYHRQPYAKGERRWIKKNSS